MATSLEQLLAWAGQGLHVFPVQPNGKRPLPGTHGLDDATTDIAQISYWHKETPGCNWAVNCGASGLTVLDVDCKPSRAHPQGAPGYDTLKALVAANGSLPHTPAVSTPSGGRHFYFAGVAPSTAAKLGDGLDTRGAGGYVLLPGSTLNGKEYSGDLANAKAPLPAWLLASLGAVSSAPKPAAPPEPPAHVELDSPECIARAKELLQRAEPANEGEGGDAKTLLLAMQVKDCGVTADAACDLMLRFWNDRCAPPWELEDLARKVRNAYAYGENAPGSAVPPPPGFVPIPGHEDGIMSTPASDFDVNLLPPRPWVLGHQLIEGFITATVARGGVGKSTLALVEALAVATGRDLTGDKVFRKGAVWVYNTEDPMDELERRVIAAAQHYSLPLASLGNVRVSSGRTAPLIIARTEGRAPALCHRTIDNVIEHIRKHEILVWCVDPFVHTHYCDENSNAEMSVVMQAFSRIAEETGCAISLVHHATKGAGGEGDMDKARGASAFGGAVRIMRTVGGMDKEDAKLFGVQVKRRKWYLRMDDAKGNMTAPSEDIRWFEKVNVVIGTGDEMGVVKPVHLEQVFMEDLTDVREAVIAQALLFKKPHLIVEAAAALKSKDVDGIFRGQGATALAGKIRDAFEGAPVFAPGVGSIKVEETDGKWNVVTTELDWLS